MRVTRAVAIFLLGVLISGLCEACSWAAGAGYFHQPSAIRGRVVGKNLGPLQCSWLRQSFSVSSANLGLYEYRWPSKIEDLKLIGSVKTDSRGNFDFGEVAKGHYFLTISVENSDVMGGWFDVEVRDTAKATDSITIDLSAIEPDCTRGHEFIENKKS